MMQIEVDCPDEQGKSTSEAPEKSQNRECNKPGEMAHNSGNLHPRMRI